MPRKERPTAAPLVPKNPTLPKLRKAAAGCQACDLWKSGTQTVFGEGRPGAHVMFVGEQPGDAEDKAGRPFVGPAGRILDKALKVVGIDRDDVFVTNVVKHFKWVPMTERTGRLHKKPSSREIAACTPWLASELAVVSPRVVVCLGATACQALLGKEFRVSRQRGEWIASPLAPFVMGTVHPSSILRAQDDESRHREMDRFVEDMKVVAEALRSAPEVPESRPEA